MFFRKHNKRAPGPTGSGLFIENIDWIFWDDDATPGLVSRDKFSTIMKLALSEKEYSDYVMANGLANMISGGKIDEASLKIRNDLWAKAAAFLKAACSKESTVHHYIECSWFMEKMPFGFNPLNVLKAYINVLKDWGYEVDWSDAKDARGDCDALIVSQRCKILERMFRVQSSIYNQNRPQGEYWGKLCRSFAGSAARLGTAI